MQLYSTRPRQAVWQAIGDLAAIATIVAAVWVSQQVREAIASLGAFGQQITDAGSGFQSTLRDAGSALERVPLIGEGIAVPFRDASGSAGELAQAGRSLQAGVDALAIAVGTALWLLPVLLLVVVWLVPRLRFATRARASARLAATPAGRDLLALRAVVGQPAERLLRAVPDPAAAIRSGEAGAMAALAALELRSAGVRVPAE